MKILAIDYGFAKTGIAISDELGIGAQALGVIKCDDLSELITKVLRHIALHKPEIILVGLPIQLDMVSLKIRNPQLFNFIDMLKGNLLKRGNAEMKILGWDESYTTRLAEKGNTRAYNLKHGDSGAACILLQEYLTSPDRDEAIQL